MEHTVESVATIEIGSLTMDEPIRLELPFLGFIVFRFVSFR